MLDNNLNFQRSQNLNWLWENKVEEYVSQKLLDLFHTTNSTTTLIFSDLFLNIWEYYPLLIFGAGSLFRFRYSGLRLWLNELEQTGGERPSGCPQKSVVGFSGLFKGFEWIQLFSSIKSSSKNPKNEGLQTSNFTCWGTSNTNNTFVDTL